MIRSMLVVALACSASLAACRTPAPRIPTSVGSERDRFNQGAVRLNLPVYWTADANGNGQVDPAEVATLLFYPTPTRWVENGRFTAAFDKALADIRRGPAIPEDADPNERERRRLVILDLDQGRPTLVRTDLRAFGTEEQTFARQMLLVAHHIDRLYARQLGHDALAAQVPADDPASRSLLRRNWGSACEGPQTERNPACNAIPGAPKHVVDIYPAELQRDEKFCEKLDRHADAKKLLDPFVAVREEGGKLVAVPYHLAYAEQMETIASALETAAGTLSDSSEIALRDYLQAAARSFRTNDWNPADEAWAKMTATNSKWYVRVGPDETYWEPCSRKAGFHLTFARINPESLQWQDRLAPVQQEMEDVLAAVVGKPYEARKVTFHLPDFIDIVVNAGDDRKGFGATVGQSLPNWGPVVAEGRGRTVAMSNLYTDADSLRIRREQAASLFSSETMPSYNDKAALGLLGTIIHEATHNLGPSHEYKVDGKADAEIFGGPLASTLEEFKAQTGALWYLDLLRRKGVIDEALARQSYTDSVLWACGHISRGMRDPAGKPKPYSQLSAMQVGFLLDEGALRFDAKAKAANGIDEGALTIDFAKFPAAVDRLMKVVGAIKGKGDKAAAEELIRKYVDGAVVPHKLIAERMLRHPKASFVYSVEP